MFAVSAGVVVLMVAGTDSRVESVQTRGVQVNQVLKCKRQSEGGTLAFAKRFYQIIRHSARKIQSFSGVYERTCSQI